MENQIQKNDITQETWFIKKWRPAAAWSYILICTFDFIIFPIAWSILQTIVHQELTQWNPITLQGAGLYHFAMGAICGVAAWSRGQEKIAGANTQYPMYNTMNTSINKKNLPDTDMEDADIINRKRR